METKEVINRQITFKDYLVGEPKESDFMLKSCTLSLKLEEGSQDVLVQNLYLSIDPYQRSRMKYYSSSHKTPAASRLTPGLVIDTYGVAKIIVSNHSEFREGDLVVGSIGMEDYSIIPGAILLTKIKFTDIPLSYYVGVLGMTGLTAYAGLHNVCSPQKGDRVFISAACGSVGHLTGQFAKLQGCYVVGSSGSKQKVDLLKNKFGFDDAFNYKEEPDLNATLKRCFPTGIDIYFENVGGELLEAVLENMNDHGRIAVCGAISQYNKDKPEGVIDLLKLVYKRIRMQGFLVVDYLNSFPEFVEKAREYLLEGKIQCLEDISDGLESVPSAFVGLFQGQNVGKKVVRLHHL
nr:2-alkenal reductase [Cephalotaxus hainanensis]